MDVMAKLYRIKEFIVAGIQELPIIIGAVSLLLAVGTANTGFAILFGFLAIVVPFTVYVLNKIAPGLQFIINWIAEKIFKKASPIDFSVSDEGICKIVQSSVPSPGVAYPSYWMASIIFFFGFVFWNGLSLYNFSNSPLGEENETQSNKDKISARKTHAIIGMIMSLGIMIALLIWRLTSGCESRTGLGAVLALLFFGLAYGLYRVFEECGLIRVIDLYGIGARLLPVSATAEPTQVCFPVEK